MLFPRPSLTWRVLTLFLACWGLVFTARADLASISTSDTVTVSATASSVTLTLSNTSTAPVTVWYATVGYTAVPGRDFTSASTSIQVSASGTAQIAVGLLAQPVPAAVRTFYVGLSSSVGSVTFERAVTVNVTQEMAPVLTGSLGTVGVVASGSAKDLDLTRYFKALDAPGTVVRLTFVSGDTPVNGQNLAPGTNAIDVALFDDIAPATVANFLTYVRSGAYVNSFIHRSEIGVIQGGGFALSNSTSALNGTTPLGTVPKLGLPILNESNVLFPNARGTIAMARTSDLNSATSQWFINSWDNSSAFSGATGEGYAVFGQVLGGGIGIVDQIGAMPASTIFGGTNGLTAVPLRESVSALTQQIPRTDLVIVQSAAIIPALTFSAVSDRPDVADVTATDSGISIQPGATSGTAQITVTATDREGLFKTVVFPVVAGSATNALITTGTDALRVSGSAGSVAIRVLRSGTTPASLRWQTVAGTARDGVEFTGRDNQYSNPPPNGLLPRQEIFGSGFVIRLPRDARGPIEHRGDDC